MKNYNIQNYIRYKKDLDKSIKRVNKSKSWDELSRDELIIMFMPLVENLARKFSTSPQASGVMSILDLIQEGNFGLVAAINRIDWDTIYESDDPEKRLKSFISKRIKGAIRRGININRGGIRIPEHKLNEINRNFETDKKMVAMFFNSVFASLDDDAIKDSIKMIERLLTYGIQTYFVKLKGKDPNEIGFNNIWNIIHETNPLNLKELVTLKLSQGRI